MLTHHEADCYHSLTDKQVQCDLCAFKCIIADQKTGICKVRINEGGVLYTKTYGKLIAAHVDPIEKKPLYHFLPGSKSFSIAAPGCNFRCEWCQNYDISQSDGRIDFDDIRETAPEEVVELALKHQCQSISYTYTEPTVFYEFTHDVSIIARGSGLKNVYVTNGYMSITMINQFSRYLDAANVDIKAYSDAVYRKYIGAHLEPVLDACVALKAAGVWLEITTLLIPNINDDRVQLEGLVDFIADKLGTDTPWHVSRFFPQYRFTHENVTPINKLEEALEIGRKAGLKYTYVGNVEGLVSTYCPNCHKSVIERYRMTVDENLITPEGLCSICKCRIPGIYS